MRLKNEERFYPLYKYATRVLLPTSSSCRMESG